ncbi:FMN-binding negative transcriptional regulator [Actinomadura decatromicini]|uniref:FMN-binding negative transcriptional regulator n=1 Tax=Actinomadura decatromicini TaxID=2604572 RepID=A0A5D3F8Q4_9ACTN|nr:FMN-binding negative transcriptional regulator [Actinomadura decatromicini]TYK44284.1 FMN-binding negative transcriptional regulator [Actinomadura decatromicini]
MYVPAHFSADDTEVKELLAGCGAADLVTVTSRGPVATFLPVLYDPSVGEHGAMLAHVARNNDQWREPGSGESLLIVHGPDAYVSPSWYPSKAEHGRAVPTWNYLTAHVYGHLVVHDDPAWVESMVRRLTELHENGRTPSWSVDDAPSSFIAGQLRAIVGLELVITRIEAKSKMSQNRPEADRDAVVAAYRAQGDTVMAEAVRAASERSARR